MRLEARMISSGDDQGQEDGRNGHSRHGQDLTQASAPPERFGWPVAGDGHDSALPGVRISAAGRHEQADLLLARTPTSERRHELAAIHDGDPVGQLEDLVELGRDEQDRGPGVAHLDGTVVDELDAPDIQAARRLIQDEHLGLGAELTSDDGLLLVAARQRLDGDRWRRRPDVEALDELLRPIVGSRRPGVPGRGRTAAGSSWSGRGYPPTRSS